MIPERAVLDAGPLIAFHQIRQMELLRRLFVQSFAPPAVASEVAPSLAIVPDWITIQSPHSKLSFPAGLGAGECAAIALAVDLSASFVVLDDRCARKMARDLGLTAIGSLGLLVRAEESGLIRDVRPLMDAMIGNGMFVGERVYLEILEMTGENPANMS